MPVFSVSKSRNSCRSWARSSFGPFRTPKTGGDHQKTSKKHEEMAQNGQEPLEIHPKRLKKQALRRSSADKDQAIMESTARRNAVAFANFRRLSLISSSRAGEDCAKPFLRLFKPF